MKLCRFKEEQRRWQKLAQEPEAASSSSSSSEREDDPEIAAYKRLRKTYRTKEMKNNIDLLDQFNKTAMVFLPVYKRRIQQVERIQKLEKAAMLTRGYKAALGRNQVQPGTIGRYARKQVQVAESEPGATGSPGGSPAEEQKTPLINKDDTLGNEEGATEGMKPVIRIANLAHPPDRPDEFDMNLTSQISQKQLSLQRSPGQQEEEQLTVYDRSVPSRPQPHPPLVNMGSTLKIQESKESKEQLQAPQPATGPEVNTAENQTQTQEVGEPKQAPPS